jgi:(1->4)-alpha-D-glucan 1-alpha-D-glucosylmutase
VTPGGPRPVRATYRVQLVPERGFDGVAEQLDYLAALGVSHVYLSPVLQAAPGSRHGYDVTDPTRIRDELGGADGLERLRRAAHDAGLGLVADIVPNHVGLVSPHNPWWWDVLAHGPDAAHARHLDVHWRPGAHGQPSLLLAELGDEPEAELAAGALRLEHEPSTSPAWRVTYHEHAWPVRPGSLPQVGLDDEDVDATLAAVADDPGRLAALLERQHYRLAHWRRANDELDHRRFFAVKELGGLRVEDEAVFDDVHAAILPRVADGTFDGLRIDHPDGLRDPTGYLHRLRRAVGSDAWLIIEKILERGEPFRTDWPVDGTVGYEFADLVLGLHVDAAAGPILDDLHAEVTGERIERDLLHDRAKRLVIDRMLGAEVQRVTALLSDATGLDPADAQRLLVELLAVWPVYRTYLRPGSGELADEDRAVVDHALARVRARHPELAGLDDARDLLLEAPHRDADDPAAEFVWAVQQLTGPVVAKGVEDTVLYRDLRFVAVNEVGGDPGELGREPGEVHAAHVRAQHERPSTMLLSSTHDTKRSADVRARLAVLSQDPDHWVRTVRRWRERTAGHVRAAGPGPAHQHLTFQTLVGAWPLEADRLEAYLLKAAREAARASDHLDPDPDYETALSSYARALIDDEVFRADLEAVVDEVRTPGWLTALSMVAVKLTAPGVPDIYQGDELWDLSLVDPDNRRPVDVARRRAALAELEAGPTPTAIMERLDEGLPKLHLIRTALRLRSRRPDAFGARGSYEALWPRGPRADHAFAYLRGGEVAVVVARRVRPLGPRVLDWDWRDTVVDLPPGDWVDVLTGAHHDGSATALGALLTTFPVALLERADLPAEGSPALADH